MAISKFGPNDWKMGQEIVVGTGVAYTDATVVTDATGGIIGTENSPIKISGGAANAGAFGELLVTPNVPVIQMSYVHGQPPRTFTFARDGGASGVNAQTEMELTTGTGVGGTATFGSSRAVVYRPGQGNMARFTARFTTGVDGSFQRVGMFSTTDGFAFAYNGDTFGILYRSGGYREIRELQITTFASGGETATVTVDGTAYSVTLTGVGTLVGDAKEIAASLNSQIFLGEFEQIGDTVTYVAALSEPQTSTFAYSSASSAGTWSQVKAGVTPEDDYIAQTAWNVDTASWLDPTKGNVYAVQYQYLGYGDMQYFVEDPTTGAFITVHRVQYANSATVPSLTNPTLPLSMFASSITSTTDLTVATGSMAGFRQGVQVTTTAGHTEVNSKTLGTTATNILTLKTRLQKGGVAVTGEILPKLITAATESSKGAIVDIWLGGVVDGVPDFNYESKADSIAIFDTAGTTIDTPGELIGSILVGATSSEPFDMGALGEFLLAGEQLIITGRVTNTPTALIVVSVMWEESV